MSLLMVVKVWIGLLMSLSPTKYTKLFNYRNLHLSRKAAEVAKKLQKKIKRQKSFFSLRS